MQVRRWRWLTAVPVVVCFGAVVVASDRPDRRDAKATGPAAHAPGVARPVGAASSAAARVTTILGTAWTAENLPIAKASVRLRDVLSGKVMATAVAGDTGEFGFEDVAAGSYLVELLNPSGRVEAVGHVFTIAQGETVATFVRLNTRVPWVVGFFKNTVSAVTAAAASEGVAAIAPVARPSSANQ